MSPSLKLRRLQWIALAVFWVCLLFGLDSNSPYSVPLMLAAGLAAIGGLVLEFLLWRASGRI